MGIPIKKMKRNIVQMRFSNEFLRYRGYRALFLQVIKSSMAQGIKNDKALRRLRSFLNRKVAQRGNLGRDFLITGRNYSLCRRSYFFVFVEIQSKTHLIYLTKRALSRPLS